ncbi:uncharacterized protein TNIN_89691 [Trichonephila inaurata madagascariensis]|uniref:Copper transport protein n=1 Tax=Trichonephila inaurata madagascariensis TaxID=2747483 RepID=A0A8X6YTJ7_9ARAC|nr:uncharacterized protein TNIN_89691 [Trichonephila inaurata madagascariensis]
MDALKLRRTPLRTAFTKAVNHLQEIIENDPVDMNAVETAFEQLKVKSAKLTEVEDAVLELMIESNCTQEAYNIEFEAIEGYAEKMIAWQVRVKNIMKTDALGQKDNHSLVTSLSSSLRLPKIQFQQFSGESDVKCIICNKRHYAVLCSKLPLRSGLETESASVENSMTASSSSSNVLANQACTSEVFLQTLVMHKSYLEFDFRVEDLLFKGLTVDSGIGMVGLCIAVAVFTFMYETMKTLRQRLVSSLGKVNHDIRYVSDSHSERSMLVEMKESHQKWNRYLFF